MTAPRVGSLPQQQISTRQQLDQQVRAAIALVETVAPTLPSSNKNTNKRGKRRRMARTNGKPQTDQERTALLASVGLPPDATRSQIIVAAEKDMAQNEPDPSRDWGMEATVKREKEEAETNRQVLRVKRLADMQTNGRPVLALPNDLTPDEELAKNACPYLDNYIKQSTNVSPMSPRSFHESAGLALLATAIAGRVRLRMHFGDIRTNLYVMWVAPTSTSMKTTTLGFMEKIANETFPYLLAPEDSTPEALVDMLAGIEPAKLEDMPDNTRTEWLQSRNFSAQRTIVRDELGSLLDSFGRDYNSGLKQVYLKLYDGKDTRRQTKTSGLVHVRQPCVTIIGASTPLAMSPHFQDERLWCDGWWARFALVNTRPKKRKLIEAKQSDTVEIKNVLEKLITKLPMGVWPEQVAPVEANLDDDVKKLWAKYSDHMYQEVFDLGDERLNGCYTRLPVHVLKVALCLAAVEWSKANTVEITVRMPHLQRAMLIAEDWRRSTHECLTDASTTERDKLRISVAKQLTKAGKTGCTKTEIVRNHRRKKEPEVVEMLRDMLSAEEITFEKGDDGKPGRKTERYTLSTK